MKYNDDIFEQMVKATLDSGEEEVPASLWEGIQARLAAEQAAVSPAPRRSRWWGVLAGLALAASIASAVIFIHPAGEADPHIAVITEPQALQQESQALALADQTPDPSEVMDETSTGPAVSRASEPSRDQFVQGQSIQGQFSQNQPSQDQFAQDQFAKVQPTQESPDHTAARDSEPVQNQSVVSGTFQTNSEGVEFPEEAIERKSSLSSIQLSVNGNAGNNMGENSLPVGRKAASTVDFPTGESLSEKENTYYGLPLTFGLGVKFNLKGRWAIGVGLNYTFLDRRFKANYNSGAVETFEYYVANTQHYIGIPINLYYNFAMPDRFKFYAFGGAAFEKNVGCKYSFDYEGSPKVLKQKVGGIQPSVNIGLGIQFALTDYLCLYLDPSFRYFFPTSSQPRSVRTVQPCQINCELGLRFDL